ncbi:hypothetical protein THRCLA_22687 [Thraustotheca clavata]|uniref:Crinkler (CRN) family protein n=1 Tax=Thraustotheca clavata TaxID=74557 RepID=A0A1V9YUK4_9STRA|nr:hypothetical protein THRCLA_22687 [Thraustotheca clavata]
MTKSNIMAPLKSLDDVESGFPETTGSDDIHIIINARLTPAPAQDAKSNLSKAKGNLSKQLIQDSQHTIQLLEGQRLTKRRKLAWASVLIDYSALILPKHYNTNQKLNFWEINAQSLSGPPGTGKSTNCAAIALACALANYVVTWIHLSNHNFPECVRLDGLQKKTCFVHKSGLDDNDLDSFVNDVPIRKPMLSFSMVLLQLTAKKKDFTDTGAERIRNQGIKGDVLLGVREHIVMSWTLSQYFNAIQNINFFILVKCHLDVSQDTIQNKSTDDDVDPKKACVKAKHYFAGGSARMMFNYSTAEVVGILESAVQASDIESIAAGVMGHRKLGAMNRLLCRYDGQTTSIISEYIASAIAIFGGVPYDQEILCSFLQFIKCSNG